jgi:hypothetical protein
MLSVPRTPIAICIKATSQIDIYKNNKELAAGVVSYDAGVLPFFPLATSIQPDNLHPIPHRHLIKCHAEGTFVELGNMPQDFQDRLVKSILDRIL